MQRFIGACLLSAAWAIGVPNSAHAEQSVEAMQLMQATNEDRAQHGLGPLKWKPPWPGRRKRTPNSWCARAPYHTNMRENLIW